MAPLPFSFTRSHPRNATQRSTTPGGRNEGAKVNDFVFRRAMRSMGANAAQSAIDDMTATMNGKANQVDLDALTAVVAAKASAASVTALTATVAAKATQTALDALATTVSSINATVIALAATVAAIVIPVAASAMPLVDAATAVVGISVKYAREDHVHPLPGITPATPARVLGTAFQPSATKAVWVTYAVRTQVTNPLLAGSSTSVVTLLSDAANPPTTERGRGAAESSVALAVAVAITTANTTIVGWLVPAGHYVRLVASGTGTHAESIISQAEAVIG